MEPEARRFHWNPSLWKGKQQYRRNKLGQYLSWWKETENVNSTYVGCEVSSDTFIVALISIIYLEEYYTVHLWTAQVCFYVIFFTKYVLQFLCRVSWISKYKGTVYKEGQLSYMWIFERVEGQWPIVVNCVIYEHVVSWGEVKQAS